MLLVGFKRDVESSQTGGCISHDRDMRRGMMIFNMIEFDSDMHEVGNVVKYPSFEMA